MSLPVDCVSVSFDFRCDDMILGESHVGGEKREWNVVHRSWVCWSRVKRMAQLVD